MSNLKTLSTFFNRDFSLTRLANALALELNSQYILDDIYTHFYDIDTADGAWLDVWGRIVAMPRSVLLASTNYFGFNGTPFTPFNHAPFYGGEPSTSSVTMTDTIYRKAIKAKALANRSGRAIPDINAVLALFLDADCYAVDNYDMTFTLNIAPVWVGSVELSVIESDVLGLRPAGVKCNIVMLPSYAITPSTLFVGVDDVLTFYIDAGVVTTDTVTVSITTSGIDVYPVEQVANIVSTIGSCYISIIDGATGGTLYATVTHGGVAPILATSVTVTIG